MSIGKLQLLTPPLPTTFFQPEAPLATLYYTDNWLNIRAYSSLWNASQSCGASPDIWSHTVLPATRHK